MSGLRVGVLGSTGVVGERVVSILAERGFPVDDLLLWGSARSSGRTVRFGTREYQVAEPAEAAFRGVDVVFGAAGNDVSRTWTPVARREGALVVDKASLFRMDPAVPLVVPEVNAGAIPDPKGGLVASPNCSTIPLVMALDALRSLAGLSRVVVSTYQAVSGSGRDGLATLEREEADAARTPDWGQADASVYPAAIHENVVAHCDAFGPDGLTREETKLVEESRKILGLPDLRVVATAVRVPVRIGHSEAVTVEFTDSVDVDRAREALAGYPGIRLVNDPPVGQVPTPRDVEGRDEVLVGRVRRDPTVDGDRGLVFWLVSDNLRKGAALNAVEIAEAAFGVKV